MYRVFFAIFLLACSVLSPAHANEVGERVALVVGNSAYSAAPLDNPKNDASAMATLLADAGFQVDRQLDAGQADLRKAVALFGQQIRSDKVKFAIFYYAGHGMQLDWRNYLIPVDARVRSAEDVRKQSVDVSELLRYMQETKNKSFLVVLDACRDDPFAGAFRPTAKGLSQFDAPVGSLLAYSTAPGNVAMDGNGSNGLYTSHLLREFSVKNARLEDAFKRVRLNVRVESGGKQIPWESTSLEEDLYLFPAVAKKLTEAEQEVLFEKEVSAWMRVKSATSPEPLVAFIREFPSGSTSELAQARLNRLLLAQSQARAQAEAQAQAKREADARLAQAKAREAEAQAAQARLLAAEQAAARAKAEQDARQAALAQQLLVQQAQAQRDAEALQAAKERERQLEEAQRMAAQKAEAAHQLAQAAQVQRQREEAQRLEEARAQAQLALEQQRRESERLAALEVQARLEALARAELARQAEIKRLELEAAAQKVAMERAAVEREQQAAHSVTVAAVQAAQVQGLAAEKAKVLAEQEQFRLVPVALPATPFYQGMDVHLRNYTVGDEYAIRVIDQFTKAEKPLVYKVTKVDIQGDRVEYNSGEYSSDLMGNITRNTYGVMDTPRQFYPSEFYVGKKWRTKFRQSRPNGVVYNFYYDVKVVAKEKITVPAGTFEAYRLEAQGFNVERGANLQRKIWVAPGINVDIAHEIVVRLRGGKFEQNDRQELVRYEPVTKQMAAQ